MTESTLWDEFKGGVTVERAAEICAALNVPARQVLVTFERLQVLQPVYRCQKCDVVIKGDWGFCWDCRKQELVQCAKCGKHRKRRYLRCVCGSSDLC